tara:strand:- start:121246 stop:124875 length:3630 start_codon:yes stop_codon:yes gene_type:complete
VPILSIKFNGEFLMKRLSNKMLLGLFSTYLVSYQAMSDDVVSITSMTPEVCENVAAKNAQCTGRPYGIFKLFRSGSLAQALTVNLVHQSAVNIDPYINPLPTSITFAANQNNYYLRVTPINDEEGRGVKSIELSLADSEDYAVSANRSASMLLNDDDPFVSQFQGYVIDNEDAELVGGWAFSSWESNYYHNNYAFVQGNGGEASIKWNLNVPHSGDYRIYTLLPDSGTQRVTDAKYVVQHSQGTDEYFVDQTIEEGGKWHYLGTEYFEQQIGGSVTLSNTSSASNSNSFFIADAIRIAPVQNIIDNTQSIKSGNWHSSTAKNNYYGEDYEYISTALGGTANSVWQPNMPATGDYQVLYWLPDGDSTRMSDAKITVKHAAGETQYTVDQTLTNQGQWLTLGTHQFLGGLSGSVTLNNDNSSGSKNAIADAFRFDLLSVNEAAFNVALNANTTADSVTEPYAAINAVDGVVSNDSRWLSDTSASQHWLEIDLKDTFIIQCAAIHNGYHNEPGIYNFSLQYQSSGSWLDIPGASVSGNDNNVVMIEFDNIITTSKVRLMSTDTQRLKIKEIEIYNNSGPCPLSSQIAGPPEIYLNQSGFNINESKRFTAPTVDNGTAFNLLNASDDQIVFSGTVQNNIGDFSSVNLMTPGTEYYIQINDIRSVNFSMGYFWNEKVSYQNAVDFMASSRCYFGSHPSCNTGIAWRDAHQFSFEIPTLVAQYLSNPSAYERMPHKVDYQTVYNGTDYGSSEIGTPDINAPDVVKLVHFAINFYKKTGVNHPLFKEQIAFFLHAYPDIADYISVADYQVMLNYLTEDLWSNPSRSNKGWYENTVPTYTGDLFQTYTQVGSGKGSFPPGHSIMPNLLMYQVALREGMPAVTVQRFLNAAIAQTNEIINNVDWLDPTTTKGQRMSEHVTMEGLAYFMRVYPQFAPAGLQQKIEQWSDVVISRSSNLWDFRKYGDGANEWVIPEFNEPGNVVGLPAAIYAAIQVLDDASKITRLREIATAHFDAMFGRNPTGLHFSYKGPNEFQGVEFGWYSQHDGFGKLNDVIAVIDGSPKPQHYPYNPDAGNVGWTEGWIAFNTAWNSSLAYSAFDKTTIKVLDQNFISELSTITNLTQQIGIELVAPLNFNYVQAETGKVVIETSGGDREVLEVTEMSQNADKFRGLISLANSAAVANDGIVQVNSGDTVHISYGLSYFKKEVVYQEEQGQLNLQ